MRLRGGVDTYRDGRLTRRKRDEMVPFIPSRWSIISGCNSVTLQPVVYQGLQSYKVTVHFLSDSQPSHNKERES